MSEKYKAKDDLPYFVTMTFQGWVDLFTREVYRELFVDALLHCHKEKGRQRRPFYLAAMETAR